jgi:hypothetical protein
MDFRDRTRVAFGRVEAYAKNHLRVAPVVGTTIRLSLEESAGARSSSSPLRRIADGATLDMEDLRRLLPSLSSVTWKFVVAAGRYELTTIADQIQVKLYMDFDRDLMEFEVEGKLRGTGARLIVQLEYGG